MISTASLLTLSISILFFVFANPVDAKTTVNVNTNTGDKVVCTNGECTTTEGSSKSNVCVNGQCWDSTDENVDYKSPDGNTKVKITNNNDSPAVEQKSTQTTNTTVNVSSGSDIANIEPTLKQEVQGAKDKLEGKKADAEKKVEEAIKGFDIMAFIKAEFEGLKNFFTLEFIFGEK